MEANRPALVLLTFSQRLISPVPIQCLDAILKGRLSNTNIKHVRIDVCKCEVTPTELLALLRTYLRHVHWDELLVAILADLNFVFCEKEIAPLCV